MRFTPQSDHCNILQLNFIYGGSRLAARKCNYALSRIRMEEKFNVGFPKVRNH